MKTKNLLKKILLIILYTIFLTNSSIFYIYAENLDETKVNNTENSQTNQINNTESIELSAEAAVLIDAKTGFVLFDKNMHQKMYPASITKVLTSLLILENADLNDTVKASYNAIYNIGAGGSNMALKENEELSLKNALYGILLKSANDACMVAAEHISGSVEKFVDLMNKRAKEIGTLNTHFANPHGYHNDDHYTTAYDMALIMKEAIKNEEFVKIISTEKYTIPKTNLSDERVLRNSNKLILNDTPYYYEYCVGGKTGYTDKAGNTLVTYAKKDDIEIICVTLKSKGKESYLDTTKLFEYGFKQYKSTKIFEKSSFEKNEPVVQIFKDKKIDLGKANLIAKNNVSLNLPKNFNPSDIKPSINLSTPLNPPLKIGDKVGSIDLLYNNNVLKSVDILSASDIDDIPEKTLNFKANFRKILSLIIKIISIIAIVIIIIIIIGFISRKIFRLRRKRKRFKRKRRNFK